MASVFAVIQELDKTPIQGATVTYSDGITDVVFVSDVNGEISGTMNLTSPITVEVYHKEYQNYYHKTIVDSDILFDWQVTLNKAIPILEKNYGLKPLVNLEPNNPINIYYD